MSGEITRSWIDGYSVEHLYAASTQWSATAELLESQAEGIHSETLHPGGTRWAGDGADAAADRTWNDVVTSRGAGEAMRSGAAVARNGADDLIWAKQQEQQAIADAEADGFAVSEGLQVSDPSTGALGRQTVARQAQQQEHADAIAAGAARLAAMDQSVAGQISAAMAPLSQVSFSSPAMTPAVQPKPGDKHDPTVQAVDYRPGDKQGDPGQNQPGSQPSVNKPDSAAGQAGKPPTTVADLLAGQGQQPAAGAAAPGQPGAPSNPLDALKAQMQGGAGADQTYTRNPLTAPILKADPSVIGRQGAKVQADRQAVDAAQAKVDAAVNQASTSGPYNGHDLNDNNPLARQLFDARRTLESDSKILDNLNAAAAESGAPTAPHVPLPANTGVQAFPPEPGFAERAPQEFADSNRAVHNLTGGLVPDFVQDGHTATHWGQASPAERAQAIADAAGMVPLPGMKLGAEGLEHLAGPAADAFAHGAPPVATHELTGGGDHGGPVEHHAPGDAPPQVEHRSGDAAGPPGGDHALDDMLLGGQHDAPPPVHHTPAPDTFDPAATPNYASGDPHHPGNWPPHTPEPTWQRGNTEPGWTHIQHNIDKDWLPYQGQVGGIDRTPDGAMPEWVQHDPDTGAPVQFDGHTHRGPQEVFLEAKDGFRGLAFAPDSSYWQGRAEKALEQADRQLAALPPGARLEWHVSDPYGAAALRQLFLDRRIFDVDVIYTPKAP